MLTRHLYRCTLDGAAYPLHITRADHDTEPRRMSHYPRQRNLIQRRAAQILTHRRQRLANAKRLLARIAELSGARSLQANLALLKNNARVAAEIAVAIQVSDK